jgi:hypothetical protein
LPGLEHQVVRTDMTSGCSVSASTAHPLEVCHVAGRNPGYIDFTEYNPSWPTWCTSQLALVSRPSASANAPKAGPPTLC